MRTTIPEVKGVITTALTNKQIDQNIAMANRLVTHKLSGSSLMTAAILKDIETYLTAHMIAIGLERQAKIERVGDTWIEYSGKFGESLKGTTYGQMVMMLDDTGLLFQATKQKARIRMIPQDPTNYD